MVGGVVLATPGGGIMPLSIVEMELIGAAILGPAAVAGALLVRRARVR
jgi:hypothetical protein